MATPKARKFKVFQTSVGFNDSVIAVPSKAAALRAWGTHQDLFAQSFAKVSTDETAIQAALANPGTPLFRAIGSSDPSELRARSLPRAPAVPKPKPKNPPAEGRAKKPAPPADRSALNAAEAALRTLD